MKTLEIAAVLAPMSILLGCNVVPGTAYEVDIDPAFTPDQVTAIVAGLDQWHESVPVTFAPTIANCSGVHSGHICIHASTGAVVDQISGKSGLWGDTRTLHGSGARGDTGGLSGIDGGETWLALDRFPLQQLEVTSAHETGHAMGLVHHYTACLMNPHAPASQTVSDDDIDQWYYVRFESAPAE
jgi:hypothetical protein